MFRWSCLASAGNGESVPPVKKMERTYEERAQLRLLDGLRRILLGGEADSVAGGGGRIREKRGRVAAIS